MTEPSIAPTHVVRTKVSRFRRLGPGLITGAADDDPGGIATHSQVGAQFGLNLMWTIALTYPLMTAIQSICARIGRVTGEGLAANMTRVLPRPLVSMIVLLLFVANPSMRERGARNERLAFEQGGDPRELIGSRAGHLQVARRHRDFDLRLEEGRAAELGVRL